MKDNTSKIDMHVSGTDTPNPQINTASSWYQFCQWFPEIDKKLINHIEMKTISITAHDGTIFTYTVQPRTSWERIGHAWFDPNQNKKKPIVHYAGHECGYLVTFREADHGEKTLDMAQDSLDQARSFGHQACCIHSGSDHHIYVSECEEYFDLYYNL